MCGLRTCSCHLTFQLNTVNTVNTVWPVRFEKRRILLFKTAFQKSQNVSPKTGNFTWVFEWNNWIKSSVEDWRVIIFVRDNTIPTNSDTIMCGSHAWGSITSITRIQDNFSRNSVLLEGIRRMCVCVCSLSINKNNWIQFLLKIVPPKILPTMRNWTPTRDRITWLIRRPSGIIGTCSEIFGNV